jgi:anaerobic selenocysteine-containing dehydrogenase
MTVKYTYCGICLAACGMEVEVENNQILSLRGDSRHPLTRGFLCEKGAACRDMTTDPLRILHPYKREGSDWRRITWDEASGEIARRLGAIISEYGPRSVGMYFGAGTATSSVKPVVAGGFLEELGSDRMYNVLTLEFTNRHLVLEAMYGHQSMATQPDLERTRCLLLFGSNPLVSLDHPGIVSSLKAFEKRGAKLIVVDPRKTETARLADIHVDVIPGTDLFMLLAMYSHIFENDLHDRQFLREHCVNHEALRDLEKPTPEAAERICGVPAGTIRQIAEEFAKAESACAVAKLGIHTSRNGTLTYWLVEALNAVTGNVDRPGGLIFNPGAIDLTKVTDPPEERKAHQSKIGEYPHIMGAYPASVLAREMMMDGPDRIRALIVEGGDPSLSFPNAARFDEAAEKLDLLVTIDFYMNETSQKADYVLPAANFLEKDDVYLTFPDHFPYPFVQWSHKVVDPPGEAKAEWEILGDLSRRMKNEPRTEDSFEPKRTFGMMLPALGKIDFQELLDSPHGLALDDMEFGAALARIATPSAKVDVAPTDFAAALQRVGPPQKSPEEFPLLLLTGERTPHTKTTNFRSAKRLLARQSGTFLRISREDATALSIADGDLVEVSTRSGLVEVPAKVTTDIRPGVVSMPHGWGRKLFHPEVPTNVERQGVSDNALTDDVELDAFTGMPIYNSLPCSVRRAMGRSSKDADPT